MALRRLDPYVIRPGDYLQKLSFLYGFDADEVWNDPKNEALKALRRDPNILAPGDVLFIPVVEREGLPLKKGAVNRYVAKVPRVPVNLCFRTAEGPMANVAFEVDGPARPSKGETDGDGNVILKVPVHVREVCVRFPSIGLTQWVMVGHLDPVEEASGVASRLAQLGYYPEGAVVGQSPVGPAIMAFQKDKGLDPTGEMDGPTREALKSAFGA